MADHADPTSTAGTLQATSQSQPQSEPTNTAMQTDSVTTQQEYDLDAELTNDATPAPPADAMSLDSPSDPRPPTAQLHPTHDPLPIEPRIPQKKDTTLRQFLAKTNDYAPLIPDAVTDYYLTLSGLPPPPETPRPLARLLALATQKFIADIAADAYQYSRIRSANTTSNNPMTGLGGAVAMEGGEATAPGGKSGKKDAGGAGKAAPLGGPRAGYGGGGGAGAGLGRTVLTMEDLGMAVGEWGVNVKRGEFYR